MNPLAESSARRIYNILKRYPARTDEAMRMACGLEGYLTGTYGIKMGETDQEFIDNALKKAEFKLKNDFDTYNAKDILRSIGFYIGAIQYAEERREENDCENSDDML